MVGVPTFKKNLYEGLLHIIKPHFASGLMNRLLRWNYARLQSIYFFPFFACHFTSNLFISNVSKENVYFAFY